MPDFKNYDPDNVILTFFTAGTIGGFWDGTIIECERSEDGFTHHVGATGDVVRVMNRNRTGKIVFTISSASPANDALMAIAAADELDGSGVGPALVKDINTFNLLLAQAQQAWIAKIPKVDRAKEASPSQWILHCAYLNLTPSGAVS